VSSVEYGYAVLKIALKMVNPLPLKMVPMTRKRPMKTSKQI
jgi:hypothetical protein